MLKEKLVRLVINLLFGASCGLSGFALGSSYVVIKLAEKGLCVENFCHDLANLGNLGIFGIVASLVVYAFIAVYDNKFLDSVEKVEENED